MTAGLLALLPPALDPETLDRATRATGPDAAVSGRTGGGPDRDTGLDTSTDAAGDAWTRVHPVSSVVDAPISD